MPSNNDSPRFDTDLTQVTLLDAELVRRPGRSVCLVIKDASTSVAQAAPASAPSRRSRPLPRVPQPESREGWLPLLLSWLPLLISVILLGFVLLERSSLSGTIILLLLMVLLLGGKLAETGRYLGRGIIEFKRGIRGLEDDVDTSSTAQAPKFADHPVNGASLPRSHRATVRYYSRMNPERVYPLLVLITRDQIARVNKIDVDQRTSSPFAVVADVPVEIEPVLPGCDCYPPKTSARLGEGDLTLTFRVVPHVLGKIDGAVVHVRQDHAPLAEVELDAKVVKQTWVVLSGVATFLLPCLSAVMKHFGLDFETQNEQGFSLYLALAQLTFDRFSPLALTALLGAATALLWWLTRPRRRDVFWDVEKVVARRDDLLSSAQQS